jgi:hypothetical protein
MLISIHKNETEIISTGSKDISVPKYLIIWRSSIYAQIHIFLRQHEYMIDPAQT